MLSDALRVGPTHEAPEAPAVTSARAACTAGAAPAAVENATPMPSRRGPCRLCQPERVDVTAGATPCSIRGRPPRRSRRRPLGAAGPTKSGRQLPDERWQL
jgi:hypothetical protein